MPDILALGHLGGRNLGDEAMFFGLHSVLPKDEAHWVIPVPSPERSAAYPKNVELIPYSSLQILRRIWKSDILVVCGGTTFHDHYVGKRHRKHILTMLKFVTLLWTAQLAGKRVVLMGIGLGPFSRPLTKVISRWFCRGADQIVVRDGYSYSFLKENLPARSKFQQRNDLAALLPNIQSPPVTPERTITVVNVMPDDSFAGTPGRVIRQFKKDLAKVLSSTRSESEFKIVAVGIGHVDNDLSACNEFADLLRECRDSLDIEVVSETDPFEYQKLVAHAGVVVTTRLHAAVLASLAGRPTLSLVYSPKTPAVFNQEIFAANMPLFLEPGDNETQIRNSLLELEARGKVLKEPHDHDHERSKVRDALLGEIIRTECN